jgi:chromosome segregation ATPase
MKTLTKTTKDLDSQIDTRRARILELTTRRDKRARDLGRAKEQISQAIVQGLVDAVDGLRKNARAAAAEVSELSSAIELLERECEELTEEAKPAMIRERRIEAERTEQEARRVIDELSDAIEKFRESVIVPRVPAMWAKVNEANSADYQLSLLVGERSCWVRVEVSGWMQTVIKSVEQFERPRLL